MDMTGIGFLAGALTCMIFMGVGIIVGRNDNTAHKDLDKGKSVLDSDDIPDVCGGNRSGSGDNRLLERMDAETAISNISTMKTLYHFCQTEEETLDYSIICIEIAQKLAKYLKGGSDDYND